MPNSLTSRSRTKTIATVGPASAAVEQLVQLIENGVSLFRLNMAHGSRAEHQHAIANIQTARDQAGTATAILVDLAGPKIRLGQLKSDPLVLENHGIVRFVRGSVSQADDELTCLYEPLIDEVAEGDSIALADGIVRLQVTKKLADELVCEVLDGGPIRSRQGVNLPATNLSVPALGKKDIDNAIWAAQQPVDFVSLSFVRQASEIEQLRSILVEHGSQAQVIAKIEKREALEALDSIIEAADGIMVARGDLGVEIAIEKTPGEQKRIIRACLEHRKPVIVATQMLESMHSSRQPTRAEVTDVANAILDGADACMLSGETAIGEYPAEAVEMMNKIMRETEKSLQGRNSRMTAYDQAGGGWEVSDAVIYGAAQIARRISASMVVLASDKTDVARLKSKQRDFVPTVCISDNPKVLRQMSLYWGVLPVLAPQSLDKLPMQQFVSQWAEEIDGLEAGQFYVVVTDTELLPGVHDSVLVAKLG